MLLKIERTIMRKTSSSHGNSITLTEIGNYDGEDVYQAFLGLKYLGYFNLVETTVERSNFSFILSAKGRYYKEYLWLQFLKNILIPFLVSLITATATYHLEKVADEYSANSTTYSGYELNTSND